MTANFKINEHMTWFCLVVKSAKICIQTVDICE